MTATSRLATPPIRAARRLVAVAAVLGVLTASACAAPPSHAEERATASTMATQPAAVAKASTAKVSLPRTARAAATIEGWSLAGPEKIAEVGAEVGNPKSGSVALSIDAPVRKGTTTAARTKAAVKPATTYKFEAYVRVMSKTLKSVGVSFKVGNKAIALPKLNAKWKKVSGTIKSTSVQKSLNIDVRVSKAVRGLSIDAVKLYAANDKTKKNLLKNGSFEKVAAQTGIVSTSLVMTTPTAAVAVAMPRGAVTWEVFRGSKLVKKSQVESKGAITSIPLKGVSQGYYTFKVKGAGVKKITTKIAVVDSPNPWIAPDKRYGVGLHVESAVYADAARHTRALGIAEARNDVYWSRVETKKGKYDFTIYDDAFARLKTQGIGLLAIAGYGNAVYGSKNAAAPITSAAIKAYGKYAATVAKRFDLVGLEVYNEFNHAPKNKSSCVTAKCYLKLLKTVDASVGKVKPKLPIIAGATARYTNKVDTWFRTLWKKPQNGLKYADAMSFHPYEITGHPEDLSVITKRAVASMKKYGKAKPVWLTELGTSSYTGNRTQQEQASLLLRASTTAFAGGVKKYYWYDLINDFADPKLPEGNFGLYSHPTQGVAGLAPKMSGFTQALTITQLGGRSFRSTEKLGTGVISHGFGSKNNLVRVVWAPKGKKTATVKTTKPVVLVAFDGTKKTLKPKKGVVKFTVTKNPVFLRSGSATAGVTK